MKLDTRIIEHTHTANIMWSWVDACALMAQQMYDVSDMGDRNDRGKF